MAWVETAGGIALPAPEWGSSGVAISTMVDGARNTYGDFVGSVVGDDKLKIDMSFPQLSNEQMAQFLRIFDRRQGGRFINRFRVFDPRVNGFVYLDMYVGDRTGVPYLVDKRTMRPAFWSDVQANLIQI